MHDLISAWEALKAASRDMAEGPVPAWPWDRTSPDFLENQRLRDRVQGVGMRFAAMWRANAGEIRGIVDAHPQAFARYHEADRKGAKADPTEYMQSMIVMPIVIALENRT
jgi:hypothetical protein